MSEAACHQRCCVVCGRPLVQQPHETAHLFLRRQLCSLKCEAASKATPAEKGKLGWTPEARRMREGRW